MTVQNTAKAEGYEGEEAWHSKQPRDIGATDNSVLL